ncbi:hypothetical protein CWS02_10675 [Enterobacter sp. EA-1]|nr:hypothetical protein CWS02_10675 [Enterobacter sp. EA-1]
MKEYRRHRASEVYAQAGFTESRPALAPLADSLFNRNLSAVRLLEYGACGFPGNLQRQYLLSQYAAGDPRG